MEDPVTIESGVTYERDAISEWINKSDNREEIFCPTSGQKLKSRNLSTNVALKATIDEWKERNEAARIKAARAALSSASTHDIILKAIEDLQLICLRKPYNKVQVRSIGVIPLLGNLLDNRNRTIRCATLELLRYLAEDDDEEVITQTIDISTVTRMFSSNHGHIRHASLRLLLELSKYQFLCDNIGVVPGAILMLTMAKYRHTDDASVADKDDEVLKSLEKYLCNIKHIANELMKKEATDKLANVLESGLELENLQVNGRGHTLASDYMIFNFIQRIKNSTPEEMNFHLVRILICLMKYPKASSRIISVIKETDASYNLIELVNNPNEELSIAAVKLLIALSPFMGHTVSDRLCKTQGQPESLIHDPSSPRITEKQAAIERLLSCLHHDNVEAALSAISTLLDNKVDVDKSVKLLIEMQTIQHVLNVVKEHRENNVLWHKSFWLIEKFLSRGGDKSVSDISQARLFPASVVTAFHHGDVCTRQMADKILMHLNKMPHFPNTASFTT
ncbi:hypothetical protein RND71_023564 [Anisodus tanguticus]|uniref:RING-type E3 ubiquitin transferase n=1 Tax=Anisodus tanguticus TaxID=243964 RepID=A0AAE1VDW6_9SOLA|nr:hypothetical protein RND71_023564 [Anisodus tanguticus]